MSFDLRQDFLLIELRQRLSLVDLVIDVGVQLLNDARRFALYFDLGNRLNLARCHYRPRHIAKMCLSDPVRIDVRCSHQARRSHPDHHNHGNATEPIQIQIFLLLREAMEHPPAPTRALAPPNMKAR